MNPRTRRLRKHRRASGRALRCVREATLATERREARAWRQTSRREHVVLPVGEEVRLRLAIERLMILAALQFAPRTGVALQLVHERPALGVGMAYMTGPVPLELMRENVAPLERLALGDVLELRLSNLDRRPIDLSCFLSGLERLAAHEIPSRRTTKRLPPPPLFPIGAPP